MSASGTPAPISRGSRGRAASSREGRAIRLESSRRRCRVVLVESSRGGRGEIGAGLFVYRCSRFTRRSRSRKQTKNGVGALAGLRRGRIERPENKIC